MAWERTGSTGREHPTRGRPKLVEVSQFRGVGTVRHIRRQNP